MVEEPGNQVKGWSEKPQAIAPHRVDRLTHGEVPPFRVVVGRVIAHVANAECVAHASDEAERIQDLAMVHRLVGHHTRLCT